jgi:hypothetical protein
MTTQEPTSNDLLQVIEELRAQIIAIQGQGSTTQATHPPEFKLKPAKPNTFGGKSNESVDTWIFQIEQYFRITESPEDKKIPFAASFLTDHAATWWRHQYRNLGYHGDYGWPEFIRGLRDQFCPVDAEQQARNALYTLKQTTSVAKYIHEFQNIILDIPGMLERDKIDRFLRGLKSDLYERVALQLPTTLGEACRLANLIDTIRYQAKLQNNTKFLRSSPEARGPYPNPIQTSTRNEQNNGVIPMDIDVVRKPLTNTERENLRKNGGCFYCRERGHLAKNCPKKIKVIHAVEKSDDNTKSENDESQ